MIINVKDPDFQNKLDYLRRIYKSNKQNVSLAIDLAGTITNSIGFQSKENAMLMITELEQIAEIHTKTATIFECYSKALFNMFSCDVQSPEIVREEFKKVIAKYPEYKELIKKYACHFVDDID